MTFVAKQVRRKSRVSPMTCRAGTVHFWMYGPQSKACTHSGSALAFFVIIVLIVLIVVLLFTALFA